MQKIIETENNYTPIEECIKGYTAKKTLLVCDKSLPYLKINGFLPQLSQNTGAEIIKFDDFEPNPKFSSVVKGIKILLDNNCDFILAIGGGSSMDTAKCIKLYAGCQIEADAIPKNIVPNNIPLAVMPTTAGSGSESTRFAVVYLNGKKQSVTDLSILPSYVFLDSGVLETLPQYQKKSAMLDAFCHSVESYWSVNSNEESKEYSASALKLIKEHKDGYLSGDKHSAKMIMRAANLAGKAINISQTTAAHAMSYKLTSVFGIAHGHAAFICLLGLLPYMKSNTDIKPLLKEISKISGFESVEGFISHLNNVYSQFDLETPICSDENVIDQLTDEVNPERLKNFPIILDKNTIKGIYKKILGGKLIEG